MARRTKADLEAELESKQRCYDALLIYARGVEAGDVTRLRRGRYTAHLVGLHRADGGAIRVEEEGCVWSAPCYVSEWLARMRALLGGRLSEDEVDLMAAVEEAALRGESTGEEEETMNEPDTDATRVVSCDCGLVDGEPCSWEGPAFFCDCGLVDGEPCSWEGPASRMVVVEYMPIYLRGSHSAAGNSGRWPVNGAIRIAVEESCAEAILGEQGEWAEVLPGEDPADYAEEVD